MASAKRNTKVNLNTPAWRQAVVFGFLFVLFSIIVARAFVLQMFEKEMLQGEGNARHFKEHTVKANRGRILDRKGEFLAVSSPVNSISINPREFVLVLEQAKSDAQLNKKIEQLTKILNISKKELINIVEKYQTKYFAYVKRQLVPSVADEVMELGIKGVNSEREYKRYYPGGIAAGHVIGFTNIDEKGQEGSEFMYNDTLEGVNGAKYVLKDRLGNHLQHVRNVKQTVDGKDLQLSIDMRLQHIAYQELEKAVKEHQADSASAVIVNPYTGEILALVNVPSFNPNNRKNFKPEHFRNRAVTDTYEPGSTIKPFTVALGLESGKFSPNTLIDTTPGTLRVGNKTIKDTKNYGLIDVSKVLIKSSNVGSTKIAQQYTGQELREDIAKFGFGTLTDSKIPGESKAILPNRKKWRATEHATLSYGYGLSATILQVARAYSVLANGGEILPLSIIKQNVMPEKERVIPFDVVKEIRSMMAKVVTPEGTASRASMDFYTSAGKTGTAQKVINGQYSSEQHIASFAGFAPANEPKLVMVVSVDNPRGKQYYGGAVAAPVFKEVMSKALNLTNVKPDKIELVENSSQQSSTKKVVLN